MAGVRRVIEAKIGDSLANRRPAFVRRDLNVGNLPVPAQGNRVTIISGMRRSGKTFYLYQLMQDLVDGGIDPNRMLYFNFDDDRLMDAGKSLPDEVLETFYRMEPQAREQGAYLFFDEIQEVEAWGMFLRRVVDTELATVVVTGSSSKLLSADIATEFRGRSITYEMLPLSFAESVRFLESDIPIDRPNYIPTSVEASRLAQTFGRYLRRGGFPDVQSDDEMTALQVLQGYARDTVLRDVVERYGMNNISGSVWFMTKALALSGRTLSITKLANTAKSINVSLSRSVAQELSGRLEEAHLLYRVRDFSRALSSTTQPWKVYAVDPGLFYALSPASAEDEGQALETAVYLELRRRRKSYRDASISVFRTDSGKEVDFIVGDAVSAEPYELVQVAVSLEDESTRTREVEALVEACRQTGLRSGCIVTLNDEDSFAMDGVEIEVVPAWRWALKKGVAP